MGSQSLSGYTLFEEQVTQLIEQHIEVTRSDAQGIVEANNFTMITSWGKGETAEQTAQKIINAIIPMSTKHETPEELKLYTSADFGADAPDGHGAFIVARHSPCPSGNVPYITCDTSEFMESIGLDWKNDEDNEILEYIIFRAKPDIIAAIIQQTKSR